MICRASRIFLSILSGPLIASFDGCGYGVNGPNPDAPGIQHVVVIFQENVSFDHYFATYPNAMNLSGEPHFTALPGTPSAEGLSGAMMTNNPNASNRRNGAGAANPFRLSPAEAATADQDHAYRPEQLAFDAGAMDLFPLSVGAADSPELGKGIAATTGLTMGYYDGNTVTALWNYAQHYAMSDHFFGTTFGPSTVGAINLVSGQTNGVVNDANAEGAMVPDGNGGYTLIGNADPINEVCSPTTSGMIHMSGKNIGDLMNAAGLSWGFFAEGFDLTATNSNGTTGCKRNHTSILTGQTELDYITFVDPFQYYASTANPTHVRPTSVESIGSNQDGNAHHQYDIQDFFNAVSAGNFPAVSFLKSAAYRDGHAGYSGPLDEQTFLVSTINQIEQTPQWKNTVILVTYDDSDGWYDHMKNVVNGSASAADAYTSDGICGNPAMALPGVDPSTTHAHGRCGYGPRLPLLVISPWAKPNYISHTVTDQTSIIRFIEDTFLKQQRIGQGSFDAIAGSIGDMLDLSEDSPQNGLVLLLNGTTGEVTIDN